MYHNLYQQNSCNTTYPRHRFRYIIVTTLHKGGDGGGGAGGSDDNSIQWVFIIEFHKPTTCTLYFTLKFANYAPTCFEPLIGSSSG
jgi:hypothetical protein